MAFPRQISPACCHLPSLGKPELHIPPLRLFFNLPTRHQRQRQKDNRDPTSYSCFISANPTYPRTAGDKSRFIARCSPQGAFPQQSKHPSRPLIAAMLAAIRRRKASSGEVTKSICFVVAEPPPLSICCSQMLYPQHGYPSQTRAPVNSSSPCDYPRLGTGREENQPPLLFQQV